MNKNYTSFAAECNKQVHEISSATNLSLWDLTRLDTDYTPASPIPCAGVTEEKISGEQSWKLSDPESLRSKRFETIPSE